MKKCLNVCLLFFCFTFIGYTQGSWNAVPNAPQAIYRFDDISFSNDWVGFVCNTSVVYKTSDKGNTWNQISVLDTISHYVRSIEFLDSNVGFAGLLESANPLSGNLFKTTNGGYGWTLLQNMQILPYDGICGMAHFGNRLVAVGTYSGPAWFYKTDDFGVSWTKVDLSALASGLVDCYMISHDTILVSGIADATNQLAATILQSVDGGVTWQTVYLSPNPYTYAWKMFFNPGGLGVTSIEATGGVLETVARSVDHGNTWATVYLDTIPLNEDLGGIGMLNDSLGWLSDQGGYGTWETQDGGITWNHINTPIHSGDRMVLVDSVTMIAVGSTVYKYEFGLVGLPAPAIIQNENSHSLLVFPTPSKDMITIEAIAFRNTFGLIDIIDEKGIRVMQLTRQRFHKGKTSFPVYLQNLSAGNYKAVWHNNEKLLVKSFTIVR
jgi:photosystem II stability/assembly factor-like uncharacterized protein